MSTGCTHHPGEGVWCIYMKINEYETNIIRKYTLYVAIHKEMLDFLYGDSSVPKRQMGDSSVMVCAVHLI